MENYRIESKINIWSKFIDSLFISFSCFIVYFVIKTGVSSSKISYIIFTISLVIVYGWWFVRDFLLYKTLKITNYELIFWYSVLRKEIRIPKKDIQKIVFIESEYVPKLWIFYHRVKINTENENYIISSKDYRNFWEILENIGEKFPKRRIASYRKNNC
jgi:hypothetical protein